MTREVCEHFNPVDQPCAKCEEKRKSEALFLADELEIPLGTVIGSEVHRRAAAELRRLHAELERCKQVCAATSENWRTDAEKWKVAGRAFLERILAAMEGVIDVADRKTDEFDALRSCVIDLTLMLHTAPPQRPAEPVQEPVCAHGVGKTKCSFCSVEDKQPVQEPVAWTYEWKHRLHGGSLNVSRARWPESHLWIETPLYAAPPQRKPLTKVDLRALYDQHAAYQEEGPEASGWWEFARAIERTHGIK